MKNILSSHKLSPIELAKRVNTFRSLSDTNHDFEKIKESLIPENIVERVNQIIGGLEQEDEFAILCKLMGTCESISKIDQNPIIENKEIIPDFLASFHPGCTAQGIYPKDIKGRYNCFVEVKSCKKKVFKISKKDFKSRTDFAKRYHLPLIFAVRFTIFDGQCYWILMDSKYVEKQGRKIEVSQLIGSLGPVLFDDYGLFTHPGLHVAHYYSTDNNLNGILHEEYGVLVKTVILLPDINPIMLDEELAVIPNAVLNCFDFKTTEVQTENEITCVVSHIGKQMRLLSDMVYRVNNLARDKHGDKLYDATRFLARIDSDENKPTLLTRQMVEKVIIFLNKQETMLFLIGLGEPNQQEKILKLLIKKR